MSKTLEMFRRPPRPHNEDAKPTERPAGVERPGSDLDDPRFQQMVGNTIAAFFSVDDWMDSKKAPDTFELNSKSGKFYMTRSKKAYVRLVAAGEVVFSPLEIEKFIHHPDGKLVDFIDAMNADIYAWKKMDPGAKVVADEVYRAIEKEHPELMGAPEVADD